MDMNEIIFEKIRYVGFDYASTGLWNRIIKVSKKPRMLYGILGFNN